MAGRASCRASLREEDARAMIRLLGETAALEGAHHEQKRFLMDGLSGLIGADAWVWTLGCQIVPGGPQVYAGFLHSGFDEARFTNLLKAIEHPDMGKATETFFAAVADGPTHSTLRRRDIDPGGLADRSEARLLWEAADIGPLIMSGYPVDEDSLSAIAIYRKFGQRDFTARENLMTHIMLSEVPWLHLTGWPEDRGADVPKLHPRQRVVMNLMIDGRSRKAIADLMDISENTVASYVKDVFRHFGVHSQPELMRKFLA